MVLEEWDKTKSKKFDGLDYKYMFYTIEDRGGGYHLSNYELMPD